MTYLGIILAAVASIAIGMFWYSQKGFGKKWMELSGVSPDKSRLAISMTGMVISSLIAASVLSWVIGIAGVTTISDALVTAFILWVGFSALIHLESFLFENKPFTLFILNSSYRLVSMLVGAGILVSI